MKYGDFSEDQKEYIITRPDTPTPWINYISNPMGYCGIISQSAGGFSFIGDPRSRRITKYRYNNVPVDRPGRYLYIQDKETDEFWSPTWQPVQKQMENYSCRHGQGYTIISSEYKELEHEVTYFVPETETCEIWSLRVKNNGKTDRAFSVYPYSEFTMWTESESRNIQWSLHLTKCSFENEMILYDFIEPHPAFDMEANADYVADRQGYGFMALSEKVLDHDCNRDKFIGMYHSEANPAGVKNGALSNSTLRGGVACAALRTEIELAPGEEKQITVMLGYAPNKEYALKIREKYSQPGTCQAELDQINRTWTSYLDTLNVETPDANFNTMVNIWNAYQCKTTFDWSRYISFYENGEGRGMGTRDSCQDTLAIHSHMPQRAKDRILQILTTTQFETGDCFHQFFPLGGKGDLKGFSDDHLWLIQMVHAYVAETGDADILNQQVPYAESDKEETVYTHLMRALEYTERMKGKNGLPLILTADWNDTLHLWMEEKEPESVLVAELYAYGLKQMSELAELIGRKDESQEFVEKHERISARINNVCWDGDWFLRGFGSEVIGTKDAKHAQIFLNPQSWAVLSGIADKDRLTHAMDSVKNKLASAEGVKLITPPFAEYDQTYGLASRYNVGRKENGIFAHANAWAIVAECLLGRPDTAFEYYKNILPLKGNDNADVLKTEPYVFCQTIASNDSPDQGTGANSWLTGTAAWMYVAATQYMLGVRPVLSGLMIDPQVPSEWPGFKVSRKFRNCLYDIEFKRAGTFKLTVDGNEQAGNIIPCVQKDHVKVIVEY